MTGNTLRIATRKSLLAQWQARFVAAALSKRDAALQTELLPLVTQGDRFSDRPLVDVGGKRLFVKELETALLDGTADVAVHSMKDVPAELPPGLTIAAVMTRANPADAWVSNHFANFDNVPADAVVGTSSLRRMCQLTYRRPTLRIRPLRGNVDTRLAKLDAGDYDAIVLARAGLERLGHAERIRESLPFEVMLPAIGQGAIAIECCRDNAVYERVRALNDDDSERCVIAERTLSLHLGGDCRLPLAAHAVCNGGEIHLRALVGATDGSRILHAESKSPLQQPKAAGTTAAEELLAQGAEELLNPAKRAGRRVAEIPGKPLQSLQVLATRPAYQSAELLAQLRALGARADNFPTIEIVNIDADDAMLKRVGEYDLVIFISGNAVAHGLAALKQTGVPLSDLPQTVAVGRGTATLLKKAGVPDVTHPAQPSSESLLAMPTVKRLAPTSKVLVFRGRGGKETLAAGLRAREITVDYAEVYERRKPTGVELSFTHPQPDLILVTSRDGLQNLYAMTDATSRTKLLRTRIVLGSEAMLDLYRKLGFQHEPVIAASPLDDDMVAATIEWHGR